METKQHRILWGSLLWGPVSRENRGTGRYGHKAKRFALPESVTEITRRGAKDCLRVTVRSVWKEDARGW